LLEIASDYSVADSSLAIIQINARDFFGHLKSLLLDMIRTEKDVEKWKQICLELQEITSYLAENLSLDDLKDQSTVEQTWRTLMGEMKDKYGHTYLIANMMMLG